MRPTKRAAHDFLQCRRIAVTGVSRTPGAHGGNIVYTRLRERGYDVAAVNPFADTVEDDPAYPDLSSVPGDVDGVVIATNPKHAEATMRECVDRGIDKVWMHRGAGPSSVDDAATSYGRAHGIEVIDGGCPLMFDPTSDVAHKCMRAVMSITGRVPRRV